ncbi:ABC transporter substrate-binding protein [Mesorhizobium sp. CC13]|uniref:ABC transporter substrate-binding protein n=1 Tax=Mesorhizobium sp. CC13 TaxID=3029194 RepID=UPI003267AADF
MVSEVSRRALAAFALTTAGLAAGAGTASAKELVFWSMWNEPEPQAAALRKIMDNYTKANPDVTFKVVWNGRQNQTKLRGALQAGTQVDFMDQDSDQLAGGLQKEGLAYDLSADLDADAKGAFLPGVLDVYADAGKYYQVPYVYNTVNFWYNKDMMKEAGGSVPQTFDELLALCGAVKNAGKQALVIEGNVAFYNILYFANHLERAKGSGALIKAFEDRSGAGWSDPAVLEAAKASRALWDAGCFADDARGFQYPAGQQTIALGDTMGELVGSWLPTELAESAGKDFPWGAFNFPTVKGGAGKATDLQVGLLSFIVLKDSPNAKEAAGFLKYVMSEEAQKILVEDAGVGVTRKGVEWPAVLGDAYQSASAATALSPFGGGLNVAYPDFTSQVLNPEYNKMFLGETTPEQFVETLVAKTKEFWAANK